MFTRGPRDDTRAKGETVAGDGAGGINASSVGGVRESYETQWVRAAKTETKFPSADEVANETFSGFPVSGAVAVKELTQILNSVHDVGASPDGKIHEAADEGTVRELGGSSDVLRRCGSVELARQA